ncbi:periplasmic heavy metal sensor [Sphingomonas sp.]|uniref:periplasmic heavy metal sensor n=1 Tax=Sphingomonas sp. TaxID=28214 RepID=UPI003B3BE4F2
MSKVRIALAASIVVNLFLAAALVAGIVSLNGRTRMINAGSLRVAGAELSKAERRQFRMTLRDARRSMRPTIAESRGAKAQAALLLRQPSVDEAAVNAALDRARDADSRVRAAVERSAVHYAAALPITERNKLADAMTRRAR